MSTRRDRRRQQKKLLDGPHHYDRQGNPITFRQFAKLAAKAEYRIVAQDWVGAILVSTAWHGVDLSLAGMLGEQAPFLFETVIILPPEHQIGRALYQTEAQASEGHDRMIAIASKAKITSGELPAEVTDQDGRTWTLRRRAENVSAEGIAGTDQECHDPDERRLGDNLRLYPQNRRSEG